jgi:predicted PurR-regulated permease PerM
MNGHNGDDASRDRLLGRITALLWVVVIALAVTFFFFASSFWITLILAAFLSILVDPLVVRLEKLHIPRTVAATLVIVVGIMLLGGTASVFYDKAAAFADTLPQYAGKIRKAIEPITQKMEKLQENAGKLNPGPPQQKVPQVSISSIFQLAFLPR